MASADDSFLRAAAFAWLDAEVADTGNLLSRDRLLGAVVAGEAMASSTTPAVFVTRGSFLPRCRC